MFESRYYIEYTQDASMFMECCVVVEADNLEGANANWETRVREKGFACQPVATPGASVSYNVIQLVPYRMNTWTDDQIIEAMQAKEGVA